MFHTAFQRGQGPAYADLPPTLQPCVIAASAPPADHLRTAAFSGAIYLLLGGGALALASLAPEAILPLIKRTEPDRVVEIEPPALRPPMERTASPRGPSNGSGPAESTPTLAVVKPDPDQAPAALSQVDRRNEIPLGGNTEVRPNETPTGPGPQGTVSSPRVHDFSMVGLAVRHQVAPVYPDMARHARIQGAVVLLMTVDERGQPIQVQVLEGHPVFHGPAMQAARQWRFEPAQLDGRPVSAAFRLTLKFSLR